MSDEIETLDLTRVRWVRIATAFLEQMLREGVRDANVIKNPIPPDAQIVRSMVENGEIWLLIRSDEFEEVDDDCYAPEHSPVWFRANSEQHP